MLKKSDNLFKRIQLSCLAMWRRFPDTVIFLLIMTGFALVNTFFNLNGFGFHHPGARFFALTTELSAWAVLLSLVFRLRSETLSQLPKKITLKSVIFALVGSVLIYATTVLLPFFINNQAVLFQTAFWWRQVFLIVRVALSIFLTISAFKFLLKGQVQKQFSTLIVNLFQQTVLAFLFGGIIFVGLALALGLLSFLFGFSFEDFIPYLAVLFLSTFESFFILANLPKKDESLADWQPAKFWQIVLSYIATILFGIYEIILIVYLVKQLVIWQWPPGGVVNLVLWFSLLAVWWSILIGFWAEKVKWLRRVQQILLLSLVPLIVVAAVGLVWRMVEYGWTLNRGLVAAGIIWTVGAIVLQLRRSGQTKLLFWTGGVVVAVVLLNPPLMAISQFRRLGAEWMSVWEGTFDSNAESDTDLLRNFNYYSGSSDQDVAEVTGFDFWLDDLNGTDPHNLNLLSVQEIGEFNGRELTYQWTDESLLTILVDGQPRYTYDLNKKVSELNKKCEQAYEALGLSSSTLDQMKLTTASSSQDLRYGCRRSYDEMAGEVLSAEDVVFVDQQNGITVKYFLNSWGGTYNLDTEVSELRSITLRLLLKIESV